MPNRVGQQLGNYRLLRLLGRGGFAEVYLGEHVYLKRRAAVKELHTSLDDEEVDRFLAEGQTLARLTHLRDDRDLRHAGGCRPAIRAYPPGDPSRCQAGEHLARIRAAGPTQ